MASGTRSARCWSGLAFLVGATFSLASRRRLSASIRDTGRRFCLLLGKRKKQMGQCGPGDFRLSLKA